MNWSIQDISVRGEKMLEIEEAHLMRIIEKRANDAIEATKASDEEP
jgi:hypothetical protein